MNRIFSLLSLTGILLLFTGCPAQKGKNPIFRFNQVYTNVILIVTDDQGYGDMSCHGNPFLQTPNIDQLHSESVRLTDFHVDPTCSPTRAALMTGRYSSRVGVWLTYGGRNHLRKEEFTLADAFNNSGYQTAIFGKWHLGDNYPFRPQDRGFDYSLIHGGGVVGETPDYWNNTYYDDTYFRNGEPEQVEGYCTDAWFREATRWIEANKNHPFFAYIATNAPHGPFHVPMAYVQPFLDVGIPERRARFYGMIRVIDENIGRLRERLEELDLSENTLIIFMTDNGSSTGATLSEPRNGFVTSGYNAGMRGMKGSAYEGGHRAACFFHWPEGKLKEGKDVDSLTAHFDILPTLVELCNLKVPWGVKFDGQDLTPLLRGKPGVWDERTLFVHDQGRFGEFIGDAPLIKYKDYAVMTEQWRLVGEELYDIDEDPEQRHDVAPERPRVMARLKEDYDAWWNEISKGSDAYEPFVVNTSKQKEYKLSSQNWHGDAIPYSQQQVRSGMKANGFWVVDIEEPGDYEIEVRRWPKEANAPLNARVKLGPYDPDLHETANRMITLPTQILDVRKVRLQAGPREEEVSVTGNETNVRFKVKLPKGEQKIQTWLETADGESYGAYYVYLRKA
ncbi:MAG: arylsulfatase [Verrucomicrobiae bacterium]|nr:arylsulfatase [Verrucomicrobiae bacterium]